MNNEERNSVLNSLRAENESLKQTLMQFSVQSAARKAVIMMSAVDHASEGLQGIAPQQAEKLRSPSKEWPEDQISLKNHPEVSSLRSKLQDLEKELVLREAGRSRDNTSSESAKSAETRQLEPHEAETGTSSRHKLSDEAGRSAQAPSRVNPGPDDRSGSSGPVVSTQTQAISIVKSLIEEFDTVIEVLEKDIKEKERQIMILTTFQNLPDTHHSHSLYSSQVRGSSIDKSKFHPLKIDFSNLEAVNSNSGKEIDGDGPTSIVIQREVTGANGTRAFFGADNRHLSVSANEATPTEHAPQEGLKHLKSDIVGSGFHKVHLPQIAETPAKNGDGMRFNHVSFGSMGDIKIENSPQSRFAGLDKNPSFDVGNTTPSNQTVSEPEIPTGHLLAPPNNFTSVSSKVASGIDNSISKKYNLMAPVIEQQSVGRKSSGGLAMPPARLAESGNIFETLHQETTSVVRAVAETMKGKEDDLKKKEKVLEHKIRHTEAFAKNAEAAINQKIQEINEAAGEVEQREQELLMFEKGLVAREQALKKVKQEEALKDESIRQLTAMVQQLSQTVEGLQKRLDSTDRTAS